MMPTRLCSTNQNRKPEAGAAGVFFADVGIGPRVHARVVQRVEEAEAERLQHANRAGVVGCPALSSSGWPRQS